MAPSMKSSTSYAQRRKNLEVRLTELEMRMEFLEKETSKQTAMMEVIENRLVKIEKVIWLAFGALGIIQFGIQIWRNIS